MKNSVKNPLIKRIPREITGDWQKYLIVGLFLMLMIGFVSGMYVANGSMSQAIQEGYNKYKLENGHFELKKQADDSLISAIETGEMADVKQYYLDKAKRELDEKFDSEFSDTFDRQFEAQIKESLSTLGLSENMAEAVLLLAVGQAKASTDYQSAYDTAYDKAYSEAWQEIKDEVNEEYIDAEKKYDLNNPNFNAVPVTVYQQFFRNEEEDNNDDGKSDGTIRVYQKTDEVNQACLLDGSFPETENEIAIDRMHADNAGIQVGDTIRVGQEHYRVTGLIAYVNYATLHEKNTDLIFDALKFDVAMVTESGFNRLTTSIHYAYAWNYKNLPTDKIEEKSMSDSFLKSLITQTAVRDADIEEYLPAYENQAIQFAPDDIGGDKAMGGVLLDILIVVIAFIFAITIANTIIKEASAIGTLRSLGYTKGELIKHYLSMPVIVTLIAAAAGNILGYTVFKNVVVGMYYNSYSLPDYETVWNGDAFVKTTIIPLLIMIIVNLVVIIKMMQYSPLQFLRHDLKKNKRKKAMRLPRWGFLSRFRLRVMFQNIPNYLILFVGIFFVSVMLAMAVGMPETLDYYKENASNLMFAKYQYILKDYEEDGKEVVTKNADAEKFSMTALLKKTEEMDEEVSVYGIADHSQYITISGLDKLGKMEIYISKPFQQKYDIQVGDTITLDEKYENTTYDFKVAGVYETCQSIAVFMPWTNYNPVFGQDEGAFSGFMCDSQISDLDSDNVAMVITERDITKMCDQMDHSMGAYMVYFQYLCIILSAVLIYLLTKIIIEKNENAISMTKILGYTNKEIASLYMLSTTIVLVIADAVSVILGTLTMGVAWKAIMRSYSGWFEFVITPVGYFKIFAFVLLGYLLVMFFDFIRIKKIPMDIALKNVE